MQPWRPARCEADVGCLVVTENGVVKGIVTDRDLAIGCLSKHQDAGECLVSEHMSSPAITTEASNDMLKTARLMTDLDVRRLPVLDGGQLVGLVSLSDIAQAMDSALQSMNQALHDLLLGMGASRA